MSDADLNQTPSTDPTETTETTEAQPSEQAPVTPAEGTEAPKEDEFAPLEGEAAPAADAEAAPAADDAASAPELAPEGDAPLDGATGVEGESTSDFSEATGAPDAQLASSSDAEPEAAEPAVSPEAEPADDAAAPVNDPVEAKDDEADAAAPAEELPAAHWDVTTPDAALPIQETNDDTTVDFGDEDHGNLGANASPEATHPDTVTAADSESKGDEGEAEGDDEGATQEPLQGPLDEARPDPEADEKETESTDEPNAALQSPLEAIRSQTHKDSDPVLEEQESPTDAAIRRPLAAQVIEETKGAHDAVPEEAQQQMAKDRFTFADPNAMAGTIEDPTGVSGDVNSAQVQTAIAGGKQPTDAIKDQANGIGDGTSAAGALLSDEGESDDADSDTAEAGDDDSFSADIDTDEGYFGELRPEFAPMAEIVDDGLDKIREAAEAGAKAVNVLIAIPLSVLELEHRSIVERLQRINGELMMLAGDLFKKK